MTDGGLPCTWGAGSLASVTRQEPRPCEVEADDTGAPELWHWPATGVAAGSGVRRQRFLACGECSCIGPDSPPGGPTVSGLSQAQELRKLLPQNRSGGGAVSGLDRMDPRHLLRYQPPEKNRDNGFSFMPFFRISLGLLEMWQDCFHVTLFKLHDHSIWLKAQYCKAIIFLRWIDECYM